MPFKKLSIVSYLVYSSFSSFVIADSFHVPPKVTGKYCDTPSRCLDPMTHNAMVVSPHYLATQAGIDILKKGGNAVDAAIAVASTLSVVYPQMNSIGGDNFWIIYNAKTGQVMGLNASGRSGEKATIDFYKSKGFDRIPNRGYLSANTVPGVVSGWNEAHQYAVKNMGRSLPWRDLLVTAISYARDGFPVTPSLKYWTDINLDKKDKEMRNLQRFPEFRRVYLKADGSAYQIGESMKSPDLAKTLTVIANQGAKAFYKGDIARKIVADMNANGGPLTLKDFAKHKATWVKPIHVNYRDYTAYNLPPNTQGMASLQILNILNNFDVPKMEEGSADYYHLLVEATKQAFADRDKYLTDPQFNNIPLDFLLSAAHGKDQAAQISMNKANVNVRPLDPKGDTVWFGVIDSEGNAVSIIQSVYYDFGSAIVAKKTGILLQNRGSFFSLNKGDVNHLEPNKRTFHTLNPAMLLKDNKPYLIYGTMGGEGQPQTQATIVTRIVDFGMSPQEAINGPRFLYGRTWGKASNSLKIEGRVDKHVVTALKARGQPVEVVDDYTDTMGHAAAILIDPKTKTIFGAVDYRGDGSAAGY